MTRKAIAQIINPFNKINIATKLYKNKHVIENNPKTRSIKVIECAWGQIQIELLCHWTLRFKKTSKKARENTISDQRMENSLVFNQIGQKYI